MVGKLLQEITAPKQPKKNKVATIVEELGVDGEDLLTALRDPSIPAATIHRVLTNRGLHVSVSTLMLWRRNNGVA